MSKSGFLRGVGSVINLFPQERNVDLFLPTHTDAEAFRKDLEQIGSDMYKAIGLLERSKDFRKIVDKNAG